TENFRFYIKVRTALNIEARTIHDELHTVFGDEAPSYRTVARRAQWFREGSEEIEDEERSGRPVTETTLDNIEEIRSIVNDDPHVIIAELQEHTGLSYGTVHRILSDHLELRKIIARFIPKQLTDYQRNERVRICKENLSRFIEEGWRFSDVITGDESWFFHQQTGRKVSNAAWVAKDDPPSTIIRRNKPSSGTHAIKLHHDNGRAHVHQDVLDYLRSEGITIIEKNQLATKDEIEHKQKEIEEICSPIITKLYSSENNSMPNGEHVSHSNGKGPTIEEVD
ncbi:unnamed protein product, partial [Rotaria sp. Silwood1]